jgi:hypothetical protein
VIKIPIYRREDGFLESVPGNYAILNEVGLLDINSMNLSLEEYSNHLGTTDNFTSTGTHGNGTANTNAATHEMDLSSGDTILGYGYYSIDKGNVLSSTQIFANYIIDNIVNGGGGYRYSYIGLSESWVNFLSSDYAAFYQKYDGSWRVEVYNGAIVSWKNITSITNGSLLTIMATSSMIHFFVNKTLVATFNKNLPTHSLYAGTIVMTDTTPATTARELSVDMISFKK